MNHQSSPQETSAYHELLLQHQALQSEMERLTIQNRLNWELLAETSRKLQVYTASIKAAVSSLLSYDIFWDSANQHEFLETINSSVNQVSDLIVLLTLSFRSQAHNLALKKDDQMLQEILSVAQAAILKKRPTIRLEVSFPTEGKPVFVDYEYLTKSILLLLDVFFDREPAELIRITANEMDDFWVLEFNGVNQVIMDAIRPMIQCQIQPKALDYLSAENILRLNIACEILHLQRITLEIHEEPGLPATVNLHIPILKPK